MHLFPLPEESMRSLLLLLAVTAMSPCAGAYVSPIFSFPRLSVQQRTAALSVHRAPKPCPRELPGIMSSCWRRVGDKQLCPQLGMTGAQPARISISPALQETPESLVLRGLNKEQRAAVLAPMGPVIVLAGPGSGKTRVLTCRIGLMIERG